MMTSNYVVVEAMALLQHRIGLAPVRDLDRTILPLMRVIFVDEALHGRGIARLIRTDRRKVSLVDAVSFEILDAEGAKDVLGLDADFVAEGFTLVP